ncbi:MAG TPA: DUF4296 domain-containing protein [bacterium]|nr:DUF4296 domain-containing protein [bacterium]
MKFHILLALTILFCACTKKNAMVDENKLERFAQVYHEYLLTITADTSHAELKDRYLQRLLQKHDLSQQDFEQAQQYYQTHPERFVKMLSQVTEKLQKEPTTAP